MCVQIWGKGKVSVPPLRFSSFPLLLNIKTENSFWCIFSLIQNPKPQCVMCKYPNVCVLTDTSFITVAEYL